MPGTLRRIANRPGPEGQGRLVVEREATDASTTTAENVTRERPTARSRTGRPCASRTAGRSCRPDPRAARRPGVAGRRSETRTGTAVASDSWADARRRRSRPEGEYGPARQDCLPLIAQSGPLSDMEQVYSGRRGGPSTRSRNRCRTSPRFGGPHAVAKRPTPDCKLTQACSLRGTSLAATDRSASHAGQVDLDLPTGSSKVSIARCVTTAMGSTSSKRRRAVVAFDTGGRGDVTQGHRAAGARARVACTRPAGCGRRKSGAQSSRGRRPDSRRRCVLGPWPR